MVCLGRSQPRRWPRLCMSHTNAIIFASLVFIIDSHCIRLHYIVRYASTINLVVVLEQSCLVEWNSIGTQFPDEFRWLCMCLPANAAPTCLESRDAPPPNVKRNLSITVMATGHADSGQSLKDRRVSHSCPSGDKISHWLNTSWCSKYLQTAAGAEMGEARVTVIDRSVRPGHLTHVRVDPGPRTKQDVFK